MNPTPNNLISRGMAMDLSTYIPQLLWNDLGSLSTSFNQTSPSALQDGGLGYVAWSVLVNALFQRFCFQFCLHNIESWGQSLSSRASGSSKRSWSGPENALLYVRFLLGVLGVELLHNLLNFIAFTREESHYLRSKCMYTWNKTMTFQINSLYRFLWWCSKVYSSLVKLKVTEFYTITCVLAFIKYHFHQSSLGNEDRRPNDNRGFQSLSLFSLRHNAFLDKSSWFLFLF